MANFPELLFYPPDNGKCESHAELLKPKINPHMALQNSGKESSWFTLHSKINMYFQKLEKLHRNSSLPSNFVLRT